MRPASRVAAVWFTCGIVLVGCSGGEDRAAQTDVATMSGAELPTGGVTEEAPDVGAGTDPARPTLVPWPPVPEPPGALVEVDGRLMHLHCTGEGERTVLLETGLGDPSVTYRPLQDELARTTRVCTYDRSGNGWSEPGPEPRTAEQIVRELEELLDAAGETGPYVLAGHSVGGLFTLRFAENRAEDVAGVVLMDATHPQAHEVLPAEFPTLLAADEEQTASLEDLAARIEAGSANAVDLLPFAPGDLPLDLQYQWGALAAQPHSLRTTIAEHDALARTIDQVGGAGSLGDVPLVVIAANLGLAELTAAEREDLGLTGEDAERYDARWRGWQEDLVTWSSDGRLVVAENSTHSIYFDEPQVVLDAIESLTAPG